MKQKYELWAKLEEAPNYEISSFGNVKRIYKRGSRILRPYKNHYCIIVNFKVNKKTVRLSIAKLVYKYFGECDLKKTFTKYGYVKHKDGNIWNNRIENLYVITYQGERLKKWQIDKYENEAEKNIGIIAITFYNDKLKQNKIEIEDFKQEALMIVWRYLSLYVENEPFYSFCYHYTKYAYYNILSKIIDKNKNEIEFANMPDYITNRY